MANKKILGIIDIDIDGTTLMCGDDSTLDPGGVSRPVVKGSRVHGYREEVMEAKAELKVFIDGSFSMDLFRNMTNSTLTMRTDTGQTWIVRNAWCSEPPPLSQKEGTAKVTLLGPPAEEVL